MSRAVQRLRIESGRLKLPNLRPWKRLPLILTMACFSGCQTTSGGACPPLVNYSAERQTLAAKELRALPKDSEIAKLVVDYGKLRAACRL
jgi:hypothetical protein